MSKPNDGGPAFPSEQGVAPNGTWNQTFERGMSLRAWLAGMAMQGFLANSYYAEKYDGTERGGPSDLAKACLLNADALIAELEKEAK